MACVDPVDQAVISQALIATAREKSAAPLSRPKWTRAIPPEAMTSKSA